MTTYTIDSSHSQIGFSVRHMMFAKVRGRFDGWTAKVDYDPNDVTKSVVEVAIDTGSIDTREPKRDAHLRSADFFEAEKYPAMTFRSRRIEAAGANELRLVGDLTIRDVTKEIVLSVEKTGEGKDPWGNDRIGFVANGSLSRSAFGLTWNQALEAGGVLVGDKVELEIEVQVVASSPAAEAAE